MTIAEGNQAFVPAPVMPLQPLLAQALGEQFIQNAFEVFLLDEGFLIGAFARVEEIGWWQLFRIADHNQLGATGDSPDRIPDRDLRCFVKNDEVKGFMR